MTETPPAPPVPKRLVVVTGLSGSGKTVVLRTLEDLGYYCVDNLPVALLRDFVRAVDAGDAAPGRRLAIGVDVRNRSGDLDQLPAMLSRLAADGVAWELVFLDARDEVLLKRFADTRRRHPLSLGRLTLADALAEERRLLRPLVAIADRVIDSSQLNVHQLRRLIATEVAVSGQPGVSLLLESFAYRRGVPADADFVFDARCLPNPHWEPALRPLSGRDPAVREWFDIHADVGSYLADMRGFLDRWLPRFAAEQRSYITVAIGCTGGRHRSVYLVERLAAGLRESRGDVFTFHRELE
jgi:UPF0042 nucleotide-binding protein